MRNIRIVSASVALVAASSGLLPAQSAPRVYTPQFEDARDTGDFAPAVDLWLDRMDYEFGDAVRPYFASEPGAFVTVVRVSTDGELKVLYPRKPGLQSRYRLGSLPDDRVPYSGEPAFNLHEGSGTGFVFAIASYDRFNYTFYSAGSDWSIARLAGTGRNLDPFEIVRRFIDQTLPGSEYAMDYATYEVRSNRGQTRYASRYSTLIYDDYYDLCLGAFGVRYTGYCRSYNYGYYGGYYGGFRSAGPVVVVRNPRVSGGGQQKRVHMRPLVRDPMLPSRPLEAQPAMGRFPETDPREAAAIARRERMLRDTQRPRMDPRQAERRAEPPRVDAAPVFAPRIYSPRSEPRQAEPQREQPRRWETPSQPPQPRAEPRSNPQPMIAAPQRIERRHKDN